MCVCASACMQIFNMTHINRGRICFVPVENDGPVQHRRSGQWVRLGSADSGRLQHIL